MEFHWTGGGKFFRFRPEGLLLSPRATCLSRICFDLPRQMLGSWAEPWPRSAAPSPAACPWQRELYRTARRFRLAGSQVGSALKRVLQVVIAVLVESPDRAFLLLSGLRRTLKICSKSGAL